MSARLATPAHIPALDGLRGVAIAMVLAVHFIGDATPANAAERVVVKIANYGIFGVDLFFVLSGFLITGGLLSARGLPFALRHFYIRRALRIFPLYYALLFALFVVGPRLAFYPEGLAESAGHQSWIWTYGTNLFLAGRGTWSLPYVAHFWSLAVEEHFYLVWPLVVLWGSRGSLLRVCAAVALGSAGLRCLCAALGASDVTLVVLTPLRLDALALGAGLAVAVREVGVGELARHASRALAVSCALVVGTSLAAMRMSGGARAAVLSSRGTWIAIAFASLMLLSAAAPQSSRLCRVLVGRPLRALGVYSYGLYAFHGIVAYAMFESRAEFRLGAALGSHSAAVLLLAVAGTSASLLLAAASFEFFERRLLALKDRLAPGRAAQTSVAR